MTEKKEGVYEQGFKEGGFASQRRYPNEPLIQFLASNYFSIPKSDRKAVKVLDLGCGSGANLWMLAKEGFDSYGIDDAPTGIKLAEEMLASWGVKAHTVVGDLRLLPYEDKMFDAIVDVLSVVCVDIEGHRQAFKEIRRCLKPDGKFFSWHLGNRSITAQGNSKDGYTYEHTNPNLPYYLNPANCYLDRTKATELLEEAGFKDINIESIVRTYKNGTQEIEYLAISAKNQETAKN